MVKTEVLTHFYIRNPATNTKNIALLGNLLYFCD